MYNIVNTIGGKSIKKMRSNQNKTKRRNIIKQTYNTKKKFIRQLLNEWKIQTNNGDITKDLQPPNYLNDYYLSFTEKNDFDNHIHLILYDFDTKHDSHNNIIYVLKKLNSKSNKIIHSSPVKISLFSSPKIVVKNMIKRYTKFTS